MNTTYNPPHEDEHQDEESDDSKDAASQEIGTDQTTDKAADKVADNAAEASVDSSQQAVDNAEPVSKKQDEQDSFVVIEESESTTERAAQDIVARDVAQGSQGNNTEKETESSAAEIVVEKAVVKEDVKEENAIDSLSTVVDDDDIAEPVQDKVSMSDSVAAMPAELSDTNDPTELLAKLKSKLSKSSSASASALPYRARKAKRARMRRAQRLTSVEQVPKTDQPPHIHKVELHHARISARKARLVVDMIRGQHLNDALVTMSLTHKKAAVMVSKLLNSAKSNLKNLGLDTDDQSTRIVTAYVNEGKTAKRWRPRAKGRACTIRKRTCSIVIELFVD